MRSADRRRRHALLWVAILICVCAASGASTQAAVDKAKPRQAVGSVYDILEDTVLLRGTLLTDDNEKVALYAGNVLNTKRGGSVIFKLRLKNATCTMNRGGILAVNPAKLVATDTRAGTTWCYAAPTKSKATFKGAKAKVQTSKDPVFGITVRRNHSAVIKVDRGFVILITPRGGRTVLGKKTQVTVSAAGKPQAPRRIRLTKLDRQTIKTVDSAAQLKPPTDSTPPKTHISSEPVQTTSSKDSTFTFAASEPNVIFACSLDGDQFRPCVSPKTFPGLAPRRHTFAVRSIDEAGNTGTATSYSWTITGSGQTVSSPIRYGVADDYGKFHSGVCKPNLFWDSIADVGYSINRMTVFWDEARPSTIPDKAFIDQAVACGVSRGVRIIFVIQPLHAKAIGGDPNAQAAFARYAADVMRAYPRVHDVIIGNEPNQNRFWQPQFSGGQAVAGRDYEATLAQAYDAVKAARPDATVIGFAISSRGNDNPAKDPSRSPVWFIHDAASAYTASGRTRPIMDEFALHPYPNVNTDPPTKSLQWPRAGAADLRRFKQALWDGFHGSAQPIPAEQADSRGAGLPILLDEGGSQTNVSGHESAYTGSENVPTVSPDTQAQYHADLAGLAACDASVEALLFYPFVDESALDRFQSGNLWADLARKPSYDAMKRTIASSRGVCQTTTADWVHTEHVVGADVDFRVADHGPRQTAWNFSVKASEDSTYRAGIFKSGTSAADAIRALAGEKAATPALSTQGTIKAYYTPLVQFPKKTLAPGSYFYAISIQASANAARTSSFTSTAFRVSA